MSMTLSFYNNCSSHDTAYSSLFRPTPPSPELFTFHEDYTFYDTGFNPLFDRNYINNLEAINPSIASCTYSDILPPVLPIGNVLLPSSEQQVSSFTYRDPYNLPNSATFDHEQLSQFYTKFTTTSELPSELPPLPETYQGSGFAATLRPWYDSECGSCIDQVEESCNVQVKRKNVGNGRGRLSAQSMAARVRRRKISEKTQELGKLIPDSHKMNTAEMFQAAFKYIKFLQAQVGVIKLMNSIPETEQVLRNGEMQALVTCTLMQEKLYTAEKCIVPKRFAETPSK
ncbi:hypothetical protein L2E82_31477 [Cichorium intybus]|uniref:Uncharacterized protein n=1 Tax=Cichorium intybus TaxID=13427 RepID=A0ACB9BIC5_CICIN|nr:hypothetical protein L2E82_31477 [Cichorium intybus]